MARNRRSSEKKSLADRARELWEKVGSWADELLPQPEPELVPVPVRNPRPDPRMRR